MPTSAVSKRRALTGIEIQKEFTEAAYREQTFLVQLHFPANDVSVPATCTRAHTLSFFFVFAPPFHPLLFSLPPLTPSPSIPNDLSPSFCALVSFSLSRSMFLYPRYLFVLCSLTLATPTTRVNMKSI